MVGSLGALASELGVGLAPAVPLGPAALLLGSAATSLGLGPEASLLVDRLGPPVRVVVVRARPRYRLAWLTLPRREDRL